jgi:hypothetical protein
MKIHYSSKDTFNLFQHTAFGTGIVTWLRLLFKHKWDIHPYYWPKALMITIMAIISLPVHVLEYVLYTRKIRKTRIQSPVFILGYFRSGTTYLFYVLGADPKFTFPSTYQVLTPHLFLLFGKGMRKLFNRVMPKTRPQDNVKVHAESPSEEEFALANMTPYSLVNGYVFPKQIDAVFNDCISRKKSNVRKEWLSKFDYFVKKVSYANGNKQLLLKSPLNTARVDEILTLYPNAKFIHIHRNPYDVYASNEGLLEKILPKIALNRPDEKNLESFIINSYRDTYKDFLLNKKQLTENNLAEIAYSEFERDPIGILNKVYEQLNLGSFIEVKTFLEEEVNSSEAYKKNSHERLSPEKIREINTEWGFMFDAYGYTMQNQNNV